LLDGGDVGISKTLDIFAKTVPLSRRGRTNPADRHDRDGRAQQQTARFGSPIHQGRSFSALGMGEIGGNYLSKGLQIFKQSQTFEPNFGSLARQ
jgi:hypothetical protein